MWNNQCYYHDAVYRDTPPSGASVKSRFAQSYLNSDLMISFSTEDFHAHVSGVMADTVNSGSVRNEEELIHKHKKERKDLQGNVCLNQKVS